MKYKVWHKIKRAYLEDKTWDRLSIDIDGDILYSHLDSCESPIQYMENCLILWYSEWNDKNGIEIFQEDIVQLIDKEGNIIEATCKLGKVQRQIVGYNGEINTCEISGFYFEVAGLPTFPIVKNYQDKHDLEIMEVIGNTYEKQTT